MAAFAHFGWDFDRIGDFNSTFTDTGGSPNIIFSTGTYAHITFASIPAIAEFVEWADALETALNASILDGTFTVTYDQATNKLTIASTLQFSVAALNTNGQRLLGSNASTIGATSSYTSDNELYYSIICNLSRRALDSEEEEQLDIANDAVAGKESHFGIAHDDVTIERDFSVAHEPVAQVFTKDLVATKPFGWQRAFGHARNLMPFAFVDDLETSFHFLRAEGSSFNKMTRIPISPNFRGQWDIRLLTRQMGT